MLSLLFWVSSYECVSNQGSKGHWFPNVSSKLVPFLGVVWMLRCTQYVLVMFANILKISSNGYTYHCAIMHVMPGGGFENIRPQASRMLESEICQDATVNWRFLARSWSLFESDGWDSWRCSIQRVCSCILNSGSTGNKWSRYGARQGWQLIYLPREPGKAERQPICSYILGDLMMLLQECKFCRSTGCLNWTDNLKICIWIIWMLAFICPYYLSRR